MSAASGFVQIQRRNHFACSGHFRSSYGIELSLAQSIGHYVIGCLIDVESIRLAGFCPAHMVAKARLSLC